MSDKHCEACGQPMPEADDWRAVGMELEMLERKALAVIATGRPHPKANDYTPCCLCPQCIAWDALAEVLKTT